MHNSEPAPHSDTPANQQGTGPQPASASSRRRLVRAGIVLAVLALSVWYVVGNIDWQGLGSALGTMHVGWIVLGIASTMSAHLARAYRWRVLIPDGNAISTFNSFSAVIIGYMMNNVIPRSGEIVRPYVLAKREGRPMSGLVATVLVERVLDGLSLAALFVVLLVLERDRLGSVFVGYSSTGILMAIVVPIVAVAALVAALVKTRLGDAAARLLGRFLPERIAARLAGLLADFRAGITFGGVSGQIKIALLSILIWTGYAFAIHCGVLAFDLHTLHGIGFGGSAVILAITAVGVTIAPTPGAFGVYHGFCKVALTTLYGVAPSTAVAFALVTHAAPYLAVMAAGALFLLRENISISSAMRRE